VEFEEGEPEQSLNPEQALDGLRRVIGTDQTTPKQICAAALTCLKAKVKPTDLRLVKMLSPLVDHLVDQPEFKGVRKAIRDYQQAERAVIDNEKVQLSDDWPHWELVTGARVVMVGGQERSHATDQIKNLFRFASLEWQESKPERLRSLTKRLRSGSVDLLILLIDFMSHAASLTLVRECKTTETTFVSVQHGYGVQQIRAAIEHTHKKR